MKYLVPLIVFLGMFFGGSSPAFAFEEVRIFQPRLIVKDGEEIREFSATELRHEALLLGFAEAIAHVAIKQSQHSFSAKEKDVFRTFLKSCAKDWVLGYKEIAASATEDGLTMMLEVDVNKRKVRNFLEKIGLDKQNYPLRYFSVLAMPDLPPQDLEALQVLMQLFNIKNMSEAKAKLSLERLETGIVSCSLESEEGNWRAMDVDVPTAWFFLWEKYIAGFEKLLPDSGLELTVSGWFAPGGVQDFERVLQSWEDIIRTATLLDMDMKTAGICARWRVQPVNSSELELRLQKYLAPRNLSYILRYADFSRIAQ